MFTLKIVFWIRKKNTKTKTNWRNKLHVRRESWPVREKQIRKENLGIYSNTNCVPYAWEIQLRPFENVSEIVTGKQRDITSLRPHTLHTLKTGQEGISTFIYKVVLYLLLSKVCTLLIKTV